MNPPKEKDTPKEAANELEEKERLTQDIYKAMQIHWLSERHDAILSLIESEKVKARIDELELVGKALNDDPELIRVWATHRIKELESKESAKKEEKLYLTAEGMRAYDGSKWV